MTMWNMKFLLARKLNMTQRFNEDGARVPITVVEAGPCVVTQIKTKETKNNTNSVQLGYVISRTLNKPESGQTKMFGKFRFKKEFKADISKFEVGQTLKADVFEVGDKVKVIGQSKGKGFAGVVKRHGFHGHPKTHGHKDQLRMPGSIGSGGVQRVFKGTRMGGRMGDERVTVKNLEVVHVDTKLNQLWLKGAVPGARWSLLELIKN